MHFEYKPIFAWPRVNFKYPLTSCSDTLRPRPLHPWAYIDTGSIHPEANISLIHHMHSVWSCLVRFIRRRPSSRQGDPAEQPNQGGRRPIVINLCGCLYITTHHNQHHAGIHTLNQGNAYNNNFTNCANDNSVNISSSGVQGEKMDYVHILDLDG